MDTQPVSVEGLLRGVRPGWRQLFDMDELARVWAQVGLEPTSPEPGLIFEAFRYFGPEDARVLILGQDPYSSPQIAMGLSFSTPQLGAKAGLSPSLQTIMTNLQSRGLAVAQTGAPSVPGEVYCGDLRAWAAQGVLLLNAALTTRANLRDAHKTAWSKFMRGFLARLGARRRADNYRLICMLWGDKAKNFEAAVDPGGYHRVYKWSHPSPLANNRLPGPERFENAPHFVDANAALRASGLPKITWDPLAFTYVFTDGACSKNGRAGAEASYAVVVASGPLQGLRLSGRVEPRLYALADPADPAAGFAPVAAGGAAPPTNNRGEYLAWCWGLLALLRGGVRGRAEIVSDCNLMIRTLVEWLPSRRAKGTESELKNLDLVRIADALLVALRAATLGVELTHVRSHQPQPPPTAEPRARLLWYGNDRADRLALEALKSPAGAPPTFTGSVFAAAVDPGRLARAGQKT